ncbi:HlyD family secretion protein [Echinimonas agarilytica]|uniref:HlyD family efflux transporter periplasmic adaptor subunit n=1 Tax=Echinimonas agarilytica TaxID=1215918 RepID=A0AA41W3G5_9GAMM|nr:HlyD family efflux transporter periplasmic adaptor subunit [Echinimonas agarilytica]MCM2678152.1 HlyD family efflux transporter periplasmic adaptor subunit [Echinimonas agarilytica]
MKEIMLPYILVVWLLVKLGVITWNLRNAVMSVGIGAFLAFLLFAGHRFWSPADLTDSATVKAPHAVLSPLVMQEVDQIYVDHNQFVEKGQLIYTLIDVDSNEEISSLEAQIDASHHEIEAFRISLNNDKRNLERLESLQDFAAQSSKDDLQASIQSGKAKIVAAQAKIESMQSQINSASWKNDRREVRAPFDGQLSVVNIANGTRIGNMHLYDTSRKFLEMRIADQAYGNIKPGQFAEFYVDAYPGQIIRGRVHSIRAGTGEAMVNPMNGDQHVRQHVGSNSSTHGRTVIIEFNDPEGMLIPIGATGSGWVSAEKPHPILGFIDIIGGATVRLKALKSYLSAL